MNYSSAIAVCLAVFVLSCNDSTLFKQLPSSATGIHFNNSIIENDSMNPLKEINIYNGSGVGAGDFNNDGLTDLYFTGNMVDNQLYLNKGNMQFKDITKASRTEGLGRWARGVSVVDINNDGKDDIYVSVAVTKNPEQRKNILYINQGEDKNGIPIFKEMAKEYGLDDTSHTTMAYFFDYDNDDDLDVYLVVNQHLNRQNPNSFRRTIVDGSHPSTGRLYQNNFDENVKHPVFTDVSKKSGITIEGYGHAAIIADFNRDGWKDIYVTNDFNTNNILYINNQNGTFTDSVQQYLKQTSRFAMGADMQDMNNDGLPDIIELDMNPEDNWRKKMMLEANSYQTTRNFDEYGYQYQYTHNTLQLNQGPLMKEKDSVGNYVFGQIAFQSGVAETDWSWCPIVNDFDDDGFRDMIITNGYTKDVTDHDFMVYRSKSSKIATTRDIMDQVPEIKLRNYAYKNNGDLSFANHSFDWGFDLMGFSNGGIWADLDNDGDMDIVINNINDEALVYENTLDTKENRNYLNVKFDGSRLNRSGIGAWVSVYYQNGHIQSYENSPYRGYVSTHQNIAHFGLGQNDNIDSLVVIWPTGKKQLLQNIKTNQLISLNINAANEDYLFETEKLNTASLFRNITDSVGIHFIHHEDDYADFIIQKLLPHKFTEYSPALAVGDIDGNQLDDIVCGGNSAHPTTLFLQQPDGQFIEKKLFPPIVPPKPANGSEFYLENIGSIYKDSGILLFDADGDGDQDMYISGGGYAYKSGSEAYRDRFYINDGLGNFTLNESAIPVNHTSKFCVRAVDYDKDGDLDLFIAGRVSPAKYPSPVSSFILRNDSKIDFIKFTDVTKEVAPDLIDIGMICDAVFSDFNNDGNIDLVLAGEWMPVTLLENKNGKFRKLKTSGINDKSGWWNSIAPGDFDNDGDIDYVAGNLGLNSFFQASEKYPMSIIAKDFDNNESFDAFISRYLPVSHSDTSKKEFPVHTRDEINKQMISLRKRFQNFKSYAAVTMDKMFTPEEMKGAIKLHANMLQSAFIRNEGNGKFTMIPLPSTAQIGLIEAMVVEDYDSDGNLDIVVNGNDYGTDVSYGRMDALNGLYLKGDGKGGFLPLSIQQSGIYIPGNGKALAMLRNKEGGNLVAASQNNGPLKVFASRTSVKSIPFQPGDISAMVVYKDGKKQKRELYYGYSFLSQSAPFINTNDKISLIEITGVGGVRRLQVDKNR